MSGAQYCRGHGWACAPPVALPCALVITIDRKKLVGSGEGPGWLPQALSSGTQNRELKSFVMYRDSVGDQR